MREGEREKERKRESEREGERERERENTSLGSLSGFDLQGEVYPNATGAGCQWSVSLSI